MFKKLLFGLLLFSATNVAQAQLVVAEDLVVVTNEVKVNSEELEFSPTFYKEGILFITSRHGLLRNRVNDENIDRNVMSIYEAKRDTNGFLQSPTSFSEALNTRVHEGPVSFNRTADTLFFTRNGDKTVSRRDRTKKLQLFMAYLKGNDWTDGQALTVNDVNANNAHPTISVNGDTLIFASDRDLAIGGMDLYMSYRLDSAAWSEPVNLGFNVNSSFNEVFPFLHADGTLYFASNRMGGAGGLDIYWTQLDDGIWMAPKRLDKPFNTVGDDFGIIVDRDNKNGYFSSNRPGGSGGDDLFSFYRLGDLNTAVAKSKRKDGKTAASIAVTDGDGGALSGATISFMKVDEGISAASVDPDGGPMFRVVPGGKANELQLNLDTDRYGKTVVVGEDGKVDIPVENGTYVVNISKPGFLPKQLVITPDTDLDNLDFTLLPASDCMGLVGNVVIEKYAVPVSLATVYVTNTTTGLVDTVITDAKGGFTACLPCGNTFSIYALKSGVVTPTGLVNTIDLPCDGSSSQGISLAMKGIESPFIAGAIIDLPNIYFNFNDAAIRPDAKTDLDVVVQIMKQYYDMVVELASHTDARGTKNYNSSLSQRRAESTRAYLLRQGIEPHRLIATGYGELQIRNACVDGVRCAEPEHQQNRRTDFRILGFKNDGGELLSMPANDFQIIKPVERSALVNQAPTKTLTNTAPSIEEIPKAQAVRQLLVSPVVAPLEQKQYAVIAGTFTLRENAEKRRADLLSKDTALTVVLESVTTDGGLRMWAVQTGTFDTEEEARERAAMMKQNLQVDTYVKDQRN